jgi:protease-4
VIRDGLARLGVRRESVSAGRFAEMFSSERPFDEDEWRRLEGWLDRIYDDFTAKAAADRGMSPERLREVAKGRVWTGADAVEIGLVDRLGGLDDAVGVACERAGVSREDAEVRTLPRVGPLDRLKPPENSDSPRVAGLPSGLPLLDRVVATMGLPGWGVLTMPVTWELR